MKIPLGVLDVSSFDRLRFHHLLRASLKAKSCSTTELVPASPASPVPRFASTISKRRFGVKAGGALEDVVGWTEILSPDHRWESGKAAF